MMKLNPAEVTSKITAIIFLAAICFSMITIASCWNDDDEIIKWNPTWLSNFRYTRPIGIRQRGYIYKRLSDLDANRLPPYYPPPPFELKRSIIHDVNRELQLPINRKKLLGWYSGPGSAYYMDSRELSQLGEASEDRKK